MMRAYILLALVLLTYLCRVAPFLWPVWVCASLTLWYGAS